jgi:hypothetical protein
VSGSESEKQALGMSEECHDESQLASRALTVAANACSCWGTLAESGDCDEYRL